MTQAQRPEVFNLYSKPILLVEEQRGIGISVNGLDTHRLWAYLRIA